MQDNALITSLLALITGGGLMKILEFVREMRSGRAAEAKEQHKAKLDMADAAQEREAEERTRADCEAANRRAVQEENAALRAELREHGHDPTTPRSQIIVCDQPQRSPSSVGASLLPERHGNDY